MGLKLMLFYSGSIVQEANGARGIPPLVADLQY